jgi:hypothetical protein
MFVLKALLMMLIPFYRVDFPIDQLPPSLTYVVYSNGKEITEKTIESKDPPYIELRETLVKERAGWRYDLNTYAPEIIFKGPGMVINCRKNAIVVNFQLTNSQTWVQISKTIDKANCANILPEGRI